MSAPPKLSRKERLIVTFVVRTLALYHLGVGIAFTVTATSGRSADTTPWWWYVLGVLYLFGFGAALTCVEQHRERR